MIRFILTVICVISFLILSSPLLVAEWIISKFNMDLKNRSSQNIVNFGFRCCLKVAGTRITYIGEERIPQDQAVLYIANHRSFFDILMTSVNMPRPTGYVAKIEMLKYPLLRDWMKRINCLFLDRSDIKQGARTILAAADLIKEGVSIVIFPEGTRNKVNDTFLPIHGGSFKIAEKSGCPIVPVSINNSAAVFEDQFPRIRPVHVVIEYGEPIYTAELSREEKRQLPDMVFGKVKEMYFRNKELV